MRVRDLIPSVIAQEPHFGSFSSFGRRTLRRTVSIAIASALVLAVPAIAQGRVTDFTVISRADVLGGAPFAPGPYEKIVGMATFSDDPNDVHDRGVVDLALAPRTANGSVISRADVYILAPKTAENGNGTALLEINNRGGKGMLRFFNHATSSLDPTTADEFGDRFLLDAGYTLVWVGWQWDVPQKPGNMRLYAPIATEHGKPITGLLRSDFTTTQTVHEQALSHRDHIAYPVADENDPANVLTMRDGIALPRRILPRSSWRLNGDRTAIISDAGFVPGHIYEFVYRAKDPVIDGLGITAVRDFVSYLKYDPVAIEHVKRTYGFGISQSARFLRDMLYEGFNTDESGRLVFDGVLAHVGGAGRGAFNLRFGQPSRDGPSFSSFFYPVDLFPFTDRDERDPLSNAVDGLLTHAHADRTPVKVMFTHTSYEYYGRGASLIHTSADGLRDAEPDPNTRIYFFSGGMHYVPELGSRDPLGQQLQSPSDHTYALKALLVDLDQWVRDGTAPPPTTVPKIAAGTLVPPGKINWPAIPGFVHTPAYHHVWRLNFGPLFSHGIETLEPPLLGPQYTVLLPQVDPDGIDLGGIRMPEVAVPVATFTGWNQRITGIGFPAENVDFAGSFVPFAKTAEERRRSGDARLSLAERYPTKAAYMTRFESCVRSLAAQRLLLERDIPVELQRGEQFWDFANKPPLDGLR